jgi:YYY domain-containing protein
MPQILSWYAVFQLIGILSWPIAWRFFDGLPDRGYCFTKHLGVLLAGVCFWLSCAYGLLPNEEGGAWLSIVILAAAAVTFGREGLRKDMRGSRPLLSWLRDNMQHVLWAEGLFLAAFAFWLWVRACDPAIAHTEQPMDLMFLSSIHASPAFPPRDAWLAGYPISYYYFGYWLLSMLAFLTGQATEVAYNLGQASWFALLLLACFGVGCNLIRLAWKERGQERARPSLRAPLAGLLSAAAVGLAGNLEFWLEWLSRRGIGSSFLAWFAVVGMPQSRMAPDEWWWWRASRIVSDRDLMGRPVEIIDEFPFFSYLLGDNHPHLLSMPFLLLLVAIALNLAAVQSRAKDNPTGSSFFRPRMLLEFDLPSFSLVTISLGGLAILNTWDLFPGVLLIALVFLCGELGRAGGVLRAFLRALALCGLLVISVLALVWPFLVSVQGPITGPRPNLFHPTRFSHFVLMFGTLIPGLLALFWFAWRQNRPTPRECSTSLIWVWLATASAFSVGITWGFATAAGRRWLEQLALPANSRGHFHEMLGRWLHDPITLVFLGLGLALGASLLLHLIRATGLPFEQQGDSAGRPATMFALILATTGILLASLPELSYLQDSFGTRMNTIFKLYYQAWLLLALAAAFGCSCALQAGKVGQALASLGLLALMAGMAYPAVALPSKIGGFRAAPLSLDGIAHWSKDELDAVRWVRVNVPETATVLEGSGTSYHSETNRVSAATGRCTLLGWPGHEMQWRGEQYPDMAGTRERTLAAIYSSATGAELPAMLRSSRIDFLYVGPAERMQYKITLDRERQFDAAMQVVFRSGGVSIYRPRF